MADPPSYRDTGVKAELNSTSGTSRWQKVVGIIGLLLVLAVGILILRGVGGHDPETEAPRENREQEIDTDAGANHAPPVDFDH